MDGKTGDWFALFRIRTFSGKWKKKWICRCSNSLDFDNTNNIHKINNRGSHEKIDNLIIIVNFSYGISR